MGDDKLEYPWYVECYYAKDVKPPKTPGSLAIRSKHATEASRDAEVAAAWLRDDIDNVVWGHR